MQSKLIPVVSSYLKGDFFTTSSENPATDADSQKSFKLSYAQLVILFLLFSGALIMFEYFNKKEVRDKKYMALISATWFSLLAPLSWFIVFKAHSYINVHINFFVWQMLFIFFGFALCSVILSLLVNEVKTKLIST